MKRLFTLLFILVSFSVLSQELTVINSISKIVYSEQLEQPLNVKYRVDCWDGTYSRSGMDFYKVKRFHTSDNADYYKNVWDKGHMAPAAAFKCDENELRTTFSYLNCALQHEGLNRGPWRSLESQVRRWAEEYGYVDVEIVVHFPEEIVRVPGGAAIPSSFTKIITFPNGTSRAFTMPNKNVRGQSFLLFEFKQ